MTDGKTSKRKPSSYGDLVNGILPHRYYEKGANRHNFAITLKASAPGRSLESMIYEGNVIGTSEIEYLVSRYFKWSDEALLSDLHIDLNTMRVTVHAKHALPEDFHDPIAAISIAITNLLRAIPDADEALTASLQNISANARATDVDRRRNLRLALHQLHRKANEAERHLVKHGTTGLSAHWHDDAQYLAFVLRQAARRQGQRLNSVAKATSPTVRFIHEAPRRAGVEHEGRRRSADGDACEAIATALKRLRRSEGWA